MGKTFRKEKQFDDFFSQRGGRPQREQKRTAQRANLKTLNRYVEDFDDDVELDDEIFIEHTKQHTP